jgi:uncharacterized alpha/beta hydrolase family protein
MPWGILSQQEKQAMTETNPITHRQAAGNKIAIIFIHGFMGNARQTWARFPNS